MPRTRPIDPSLFDNLLASGDGAPSPDQKIEHAIELARASNDNGRSLLAFLLDHVHRGRAGLAEARNMQEKLRALIELVDQPPWHPAVFLRRVPGAGLPRAVVMHGGQSRVVGYAEGVAVDDVRSGDEVFLSKDLHLVMAKSPYGLPPCGETAFFERHAGFGRCVLRWRDEEVVADMADSLHTADLKRGDQVRWERSAWMAFEKIERAAGREYFLPDVEDIAATSVGGQDNALDTVLSLLTSLLVEPQLARLYGLTGCQSLLMEGPPGCGKTLMAKAAAAEVRRRSGQRCRFAVVKPGEWLSPWVGETEQNIRNTFRALSEAADDGFAILFLDEVEAIGRIRGGTIGHHSDAALACLLAELNGFKHRGGVSVICATNRADLIDPALLERLSDVTVKVRRPDLAGAQAIFSIHLPEGLPYTEPREALVAAAVGRFFAPNGNNDLTRLRFRDGTSRVVYARELVSGRLIAQVCAAACRRAFDRHCKTGEGGVRVSDMQDAVADAFARLSTTLTRHNVHAYLSDLPQDVDVVAVEPIVRRVARPHEWLRAA